jgi:hypothetical protein
LAILLLLLVFGSYPAKLKKENREKFSEYLLTLLYTCPKKGVDEGLCPLESTRP